MGHCYYPPMPLEEENYSYAPSDSKLLKVIEGDSQNSNSESTIDKTPKLNEMSTTFSRSQGTRIPRRIQ